MYRGVIVGLADLLENFRLSNGLGEVDDLAEDVCLTEGTLLTEAQKA